jgi:hypothetical protein
MADDERRRLSQHELTRVLQKAVERDGREGPSIFTREDAIAAGRELGLDPGTVERVMSEHLASQSAVDPVLRPFNTRIALEETSERFVLRIPPRGPAGPALMKLGAGGAAAVFAAFWAGQAASRGGPWFLPLFAVPFALVGLAWAGAGVASMVVGHRLELRRQGGRLIVTPLGTASALDPGQLRAHLDVEHVHTQDGSQDVPFLALEHGTHTHKLLMGFSPADQRWVHRELERWLRG